MSTSVTLRGPLLDGSAPRIVQRYMPAMQRRVAQQGTNRIHARLKQVLKHPTGRYQRTVVTDVSSKDPRTLGDRKVYGAWLEGTSRLNQRTRFKGYKTFRIVRRQLQQDVPQIIQPEVDRMVRELGGVA